MTVSSARNNAAPAARPGAAKGRIRRSNEEAILRAAESEFARAGFKGARVAEIARRAGIPQANLHYYFKGKRALYRAVLDNILTLWLAETDIIRHESDPAAAIEQYVRMKMHFSRRYPEASKVFANEVIHGARELGPYLRKELKDLVDDRASVLEGWMRVGRMAPLDPRHLFFFIWAATQTYADFETQVRAVLGVKRLDDEAYTRATEEIVALVLRACGFPHVAIHHGTRRRMRGPSKRRAAQ